MYLRYHMLASSKVAAPPAFATSSVTSAGTFQRTRLGRGPTEGAAETQASGASGFQKVRKAGSSAARNLVRARAWLVGLSFAVMPTLERSDWIFCAISW